LAEPTGSKEEQAISDFEFRGLKFGTSLESFKEKLNGHYATAEGLAEPQNSVDVFVVTADGADLVYLWFFESKLFQITFLYEPATVNKIGGWETIIEKIREKFGRPVADSEGTNSKDEGIVASFFWKFRTVHRYIEVLVKKTSMKAEFTETESYLKWQERRKKGAKVGF
jgi:hypothetical protein